MFKKPNWSFYATYAGKQMDLVSNHKYDQYDPILKTERSAKYGLQ